MERIKNNKFALVLFIASLIILAVGVLDIIATFIGTGTTIELLKIELAKQTTDQALIDKTANTLMVSIYVGVVVGAIVLLFEVLCGLKSSMYAKWKIGAIVFGVISVALYVVGAIYLSTSWINWISAIVDVMYLVGAIGCITNSKKVEE